MEPTRGLIVTRDEPELALEVMEAMIGAGAGWINVSPEIPDDVKVPQTPGAMAVFSKRGPAVPLGTWTPPTPAGSRTEPAQVGIQHGIGALVVPHLGSSTARVPPTWRVIQDHARRGFVGVPPPDAPLTVVLDWMLLAIDQLCLVPHTGRFLVYVYEPTRRR